MEARFAPALSLHLAQIECGGWKGSFKPPFCTPDPLQAVGTKMPLKVVSEQPLRIKQNNHALCPAQSYPSIRFTSPLSL